MTPTQRRCIIIRKLLSIRIEPQNTLQPLMKNSIIKKGQLRPLVYPNLVNHDCCINSRTYITSIIKDKTTINKN